MTKPDVGKQEIEAAMGRIIWRWHHIEATLAQMFAALLGLPHMGEDAHLAHKVFFTPVNFRTQIDMVSTVLEHRVVDEAIRKQWRRLCNDLYTVKKWRDSCAHCTVAMDTNLNTHVAMLTPFSRKFEKPEGQMTLGQLEEAEEIIRQAGITVAKFSRELPTFRKG